jgi:capsular polysaccharide export protein
MSSQQKFLLLQGPASPFFKKLGLELISMGHLAWKVNFCGGDKVMSWGKLPQFNFRGDYKDFNSWLTALFKEYQFTHIILFGDTRPLHIEAIRVAKSFHCQVYVYEEGYLRPDWVTMEKNGVNGYSELIIKNKEFNWLNCYQPLHESYSPQNSGINTNLRFLQDLIYRFFTFLFLPFYPFYKTYRPRNAFIEYLGWAKRIPLKFLKINNEERTINNLIRHDKFYYFLPLQLNSDAQIRTHSTFSSIANMLATVLKSFAKYANDDSLLVI